MLLRRFSRVILVRMTMMDVAWLGLKVGVRSRMYLALERARLVRSMCFVKVIGRLLCLLVLI